MSPNYVLWFVHDADGTFEFVFLQPSMRYYDIRLDKHDYICSLRQKKDTSSDSKFKGDHRQRCFKFYFDIKINSQPFVLLWVKKG